MFPTTQNSPVSLAAALRESKVESTASSAGKAFLKFDFKTGDFQYGREATDVSNEDIVINTYSIVHGWLLWVSGSPQKLMVPFSQTLPAPMAPQGDATPAEARGFEARFEDEADTVLVFETNSFGGRQGVDTLLSSIRAKVFEGEENYLFPVVKLTSTSYKHKAGNTIHNPKFEVVGWVNQDGERAPEQLGEFTEPEEAAPVKRRRRA